MRFFILLSEVIDLIVKAVIVAVAVLLIVRFIINLADLNPFGWFALRVRRLSDPLISPVRRTLASMGVDPKFAPFITLLLTILVGWFALQLVSAVLNTIVGVLVATGVIPFNRDPSITAALGYILYGTLALYSLALFIRIIFSWLMVSYVNPVMRFLVQVTDPLLLPLRRMMPPLGMFDLSPILAFILIWLFQSAIAGTLLGGWPKAFVG